VISTNKTTFVIKRQERVIEATQLLTGVITKVDVNTFLSFLKKFLNSMSKTKTYCSKAKIELALGKNLHLSNTSNKINTYLTPDLIRELIDYIRMEFPDIEKTSELLSSKEQEVPTAKKQELSKEEKIKQAPLINTAEYEEPHYDYEYCNGYPNQNFIGILGKNGETIEIDFNAHENLFDPKNGGVRNYPVAHAFNLYDENHENLAYRYKFILFCTHIKEEALFQIYLVPTEDIEYYGQLLKAREKYKLAVGRLPQPIKFKNSLSELIEETDDEELPWIA